MFAQLALFASLALAKTIEIGVGDGGLVFKPNSTTAAVGDILSFKFYPRRHSVVSGSYDKACDVSGPNAIFSGYYSASAGQTNETIFTVPVNNTDPLWLYCSEAKHCQSGMVMVVNPPAESSGRSLAKYAAGAKNAQNNVEPSGLAVKGGRAVLAASASPASSAAGGAAGRPTSAGSATGTKAPTGTNTAAGSATAATSRASTGGAPAATGFGVAAGAVAAGLAVLL